MTLDLEHIKEAARAAMNEPWAFPDNTPIAQYASVANPAAVLALIERLEQAEETVGMRATECDAAPVALGKMKQS